MKEQALNFLRKDYLLNVDMIECIRRDLCEIVFASDKAVLIAADGGGVHMLSCEDRELGFDLLPGEHPIVPVMLYDPKVAHEFARRMLDKGVYVVAFCYPVVPKGKDRIRTQISAGHTKEDLDFAIRCFGEVKAEMGL